jgi:hypothetical protein
MSSHRAVAHRAGLVIDALARPDEAKTFVYLNGGRVLGIAPLSIQFSRPGRYRLLFWTPSMGRQVNREIVVTGRGRQWVSAATAR